MFFYLWPYFIRFLPPSLVLSFLRFDLVFLDFDNHNKVHVWSLSSCPSQCANQLPYFHFCKEFAALLVNTSILCKAWETSFTTCCLILGSVQGMLASSSAMCTCVINCGGVTLLSTRYSTDSLVLSLMRMGMTWSVFLGDDKIFGGLRAGQKSSASQPERYPWLVIRAKSRILVFSPVKSWQCWDIAFRECWFWSPDEVLWSCFFPC